MINLNYAFYHLECVVSIIRGEREALDRMDISADGFWRSFSAIPIALPAMFFTWVIGARQTQAEIPTISMSAIVGADAVLELFLWLLPVVAFAVVLGPIGFGPRFTHLIVVRNWSAVLMAYLAAALLSPYAVLGADNGVMMLVTLALFVAILVVAVRITQTALDSATPTAIGLVAAELAIGLFIAASFYALVFPSSA